LQVSDEKNNKMIDTLLKKHSLRITKVRMSILECFAESDTALSHSDIEQKFSNEFDRVTVYRTLNSFLEKGLLHKVPDDSGIAKFGLCQHNCNEHQHYDNHVHFKCEKCSKVQCFHDIAIPSILGLNECIIHSSQLLLQGVCIECQD